MLMLGLLVPFYPSFSYNKCCCSVLFPLTLLSLFIPCCSVLFSLTLLSLLPLLLRCLLVPIYFSFTYYLLLIHGLLLFSSFSLYPLLRCLVPLFLLFLFLLPTTAALSSCSPCVFVSPCCCIVFLPLTLLSLIIPCRCSVFFFPFTLRSL